MSRKLRPAGTQMADLHLLGGTSLYEPLPLYLERHTQGKKSTETMPRGYYCHKWYPFFNRAKTVTLGAPNYGQPNSTPRGAVSAPFFSECMIRV